MLIEVYHDPSEGEASCSPPEATVRRTGCLLLAADFLPPTGPPRAGVASYGGKMVPDSFSILVVTK